VTPDQEHALTTRIDKNHPWFSPVDDAATDMANYWMSNMTEDDDTIFELIEDRAVEVGISVIDMENGSGEEWKTHEAFEFACVKRARIKLLRLLAEEMEEM
jgi:hypothetical protein